MFFDKKILVTNDHFKYCTELWDELKHKDLNNKENKIFDDERY